MAICSSCRQIDVQSSFRDQLDHGDGFGGDTAVAHPLSGVLRGEQVVGHSAHARALPERKMDGGGGGGERGEGERGSCNITLYSSASQWHRSHRK